MSATYDPNLSTDKDWVRFLVGDRDVSSPTFQDEEIVGVLAEEANKYLAAARLGDTILAKSEGLITKQVDDLKLQWNDTPENSYARWLGRLRARGLWLQTPRSRAFKTL